MRLAALLLAAASLVPLRAQNNAQPQVPDCVIFINGLTAAGSTANFFNGYTQCQTWTIAYSSVGFTGLTLTFQSAPAATAPVGGTSQGTPGAFVTYAGTVVSGSNPNTSTTGANATFSNGTVDIPWVRVNLSGLTGSGTVWGVVYGYRTGYSSTTVNPGAGCPNPCPVEGLANSGSAVSGPPVLTAIWDGTNVRTPVYCPNQAVINASTMGDTQIVALTSMQRIYVCQISLSNASGVNIQFDQGTGMDCGTGTTALTGNYQNVLTAILPFGSTSPLVNGAGTALCINLGANVSVQGTVLYAKF